MERKVARAITERQKKGVLSSLKRAKQPKNVLVSNDHELWPTLNDNQFEEFKKVFQEYCSENTSSHHIVIGLESTLRHLKADKVKFLMLANELSPKFFTKNLLSMVLHKNENIRIVMIPKLRELSKNLLKTPAIMVAIDSSANSMKLDNFYDKLDLHSKMLKHFVIMNPQSFSNLDKKQKKIKTQSHPVVLLKKPSHTARAFDPMKIENTIQFSEASQSMSSDFLRFSDINISTSRLSSNAPPSIMYRPISIKRIVGNSNRKKTT